MRNIIKIIGKNLPAIGLGALLTIFRLQKNDSDNPSILPNNGQLIFTSLLLASGLILLKNLNYHRQNPLEGNQLGQGPAQPQPQPQQPQQLQPQLQNTASIRTLGG